MSGAAFLLTLTLLASESLDDEQSARRAEAAFAEGVRLRERLPRPPETIEADIEAVEADVLRLLKEVAG